MWTCSKCGGNVADHLSACQSCGTGADGAAAPAPPTVDTLDRPPQLNGITAAPSAEIELKPVVPPPPTLQDRLIRAAKAGAIYGALYGAMYCLILWIGMMTLMGKAVQFSEGPAAALGEGLVKGALVGMAVGVPVAVLFRLAVPYKPPKSRSKD